MRTARTIVLLQLLAVAPTISRAADDVDCATARPPPNADQELDQAMALRVGNHLDAAEAKTKAILDHAPNNPRALYSRGMVELDRGELTKARATLRTAIDVKSRCGVEAGPLNVNVYNNAGLVELKLSNYAEAEKYLRQALLIDEAATDPKDKLPASSKTKVMSNLGYVYFVTGSYDKAKPLLDQAATRGSSAASYTRNLIQKTEAKLHETQ